TNLADYYKAPFGIGEDDSLLPWLAGDAVAQHTVATVVHDDLGQDAAKLFPDLVGKAGVYLRPSIIAADGYDYRAQVSFEAPPAGASHPNREVLKARYAKLPQAHLATLRVWRKTSIRGYVGWVDAPVLDPTWQDALTKVMARYTQANVHFVNEGGGG